MVFSQDIHYTNFGFSPLNINPALTGSFKGDMRFMGNYRSQWNSVPVSYLTFSGGADMKLGNSLLDTRHWRVGLLFNYDQAGDSHLNNSSLYGTIAYALPVSATGSLSVGGSLGYNQRAFKTADLYFDDQYKDLVFSANNHPQEVILDKTINYMDISGGVNYHHQAITSRTSFDAGVGLFHLNTPNKSFAGDPAVNCEVRKSAYVNSAIAVSKNVDLLVDAMAQFQGPHTEYLIGVGGRLFIANKALQQIALQGGLTLRNGDAIVPHLGLIYDQWRVAVNYDFNFSQFKTASVWNGGPEINVHYIISRVPAAKYCPLCPVYL